ncbi:MAG: uroporphyrinogen-III synthase, partial [Silvibacterium sp.]|nr:uroporphyrinogen-III synthase [Silvibacterium sp.]
ILVTRARHQARQLSAQLTELGAEVIEIPAIEILPPETWDPLDAALRNAQQYQWLIVTSANTVKSIAERLATLGLPASHLGRLKIAAVGPATTRALNEAGLSTSITPEEYVAESLISAIGDQVRGSRVLIARAAVARDVIPEALRAAGAQVDVVDAYRNVIPESSIHRIAEVFAPEQPPPAAATFTSSSTVTNFFHLLSAAGLERPRGMLAVSIGPITTQTLRDHGWKPASEADPHDIPGLIAAIVRTLSPDH